MLLLHHYINKSVDLVFDGTMPTYDGYDWYLPPFQSVILVPCNSEDPDHLTPSIDSCQLLTRTGVQTAERTGPLLVMYLIDNTSDVGLLLKHGDLLGAYYTGPHEHIKAERSYMFIDNYFQLVQDQNYYWADIESTAINEINDDDDDGGDEDPTLDEFVLMSLTNVNDA